MFSKTVRLVGASALIVSFAFVAAIELAPWLAGRVVCAPFLVVLVGGTMSYRSPLPNLVEYQIDRLDLWV